MTTATHSKPAQPAKPALDVNVANAQLQDADAAAIVTWAAQQFPTGLVMTSSFGAESALMLHLVTRTIPDIPVIVIDTGYLFPETYQFIDQLSQRLKLNLQIFTAPMSTARMEALHGPLWETDQDRYLQIRKVEPMDRALRELNVKAWLAGLRANQTKHRAALHTVELQDGIYKVHPILTWSTKDIFEYMKKHDLPYHPLYEKGYPSIGDTHSTRPITAGQDARSGRFSGLKQECGLHVPKTREEDASRSSADI